MEHGCIFGDSLARGVVLDGETKKYRIGGSFVELVAAKLGLVIDNFSKFGATVFKGGRMLDNRADSLGDYDFVALEFGGNDSDFAWDEIAKDPDAVHLPKTPIKAFCGEYRRMIREVFKRGGRPVVISLPPIDENRYFEWFSKGLDRANILKWLGGSTRFIYNFHESYNLGVCRLAAAEGVPIIDVRGTFLTNRRYRDCLCEDGIHLNEQGHALAAAAIEAGAAELRAAKK